MAPNTTRTERIARRVEAEMHSQGMSLYRLSERAHIPRTTLRNQLAAAAEFKVEQLFKVCEALGLTMSELLRDVDGGEAA